MQSNLKEQVYQALSKRGFYLLDLYRYIKTDISLSAFQLFMNAGREADEWHCADGYYTLTNPMPTIELPSPSTLEVDYLINTARQFTHPAQKDRDVLDREGYYNHESYSPKRATLLDMFTDNTNGFQIVPGKFEKNADGKIKRKECWFSSQVFMVECDSDVPFKSLEEVFEYDNFVRDNAVALIESIRSQYDDPKDATCNGELRYRAFFLMPKPVVSIDAADFLIQRLLENVPGADASGSNITNGAMGLKGANIKYLGNYVGQDYIDAWLEQWETYQTEQSRYQPTEQINISEIPERYQEALGELDFKGDGWSRQMLPCIFAKHEHDGWGKASNAMGVFRHSDKLGYTFRCFKCDPPDNKRTFRVKPRRNGRKRVKQVGDSESVYEVLETAQVENERVWDLVTADRVFPNQRAILIQTDTGVGKDQAMLMNAYHNDIFSLNPHSRLSAQIHERAEKEYLESYHIRSRLHGWEKIEDLDLPERIKVFKADPDIMCVHADRCQALLDQTDSCKDTLCNPKHCEVYEFCSEHRYVSQIPKAAQAKIAHYSWVQLVTDPGAKGTVEQIMNARKKADRHGNLIWVVGEVDAQKLLNRHTIPVTEIQKGIGTWQHEPAGELYRMLGEMCNPVWTGYQRWEHLVKVYPKIEHQVASRQLSKYPLKNEKKVRELTITKALKEKVISVRDLENIYAIPRMYAKHWTPIQWLESFLMHCQNPEPPIVFTGDALEFVTPPVLHPKVNIYVMQSATANAGQIENLLRMTTDDLDFDVATGARVEHHKGTRIFKVATGRYVRSSCFEYADGYSKVIGLRDMIRPHLENLLGILKSTPGPKFINTYKPIYDGHELEHEPLIQKLRELPDVEWSNWAAGYGLDLDPETLLIEFGTNEPSEEVLKVACAEVNLHDPEPLDFSFDEYHEHDGIHIEGVRTYKDKRVQAQYEQMVEMSQYQMANRTRPVRNPSLVLIYSSHPCKWLDNRVQWVTPDVLGGNLRDFSIPEPETRYQREKAEKRDIAVELAKEGLSNTEIATQLGYKSVSSVANLLKGLEL